MSVQREIASVNLNRLAARLVVPCIAGFPSRRSTAVPDSSLGILFKRRLDYAPAVRTRLLVIRMRRA